MRPNLKPGERCPLHRSMRCICHGPQETRPPRQHVGPVRRVEDPHHPHGYREICSPAELRRRKHRLIADDPRCWICVAAEKPEEECRFQSYEEIDLEHKEPKGMNGARHDDHMTNLALAHRVCNSEKGSRRIRA
jgi:hypothetical protein